MDKILKQLKKLQYIKPTEDFKHQSKLIILQNTKPSFSLKLNEIFRFSGALTLTASFIVLLVGGLIYLKNSPLPLTMAGLNIKTLEAEARNLKLDITISEIESYEITQDNVSVALSQTISNDPIHFESIILNKETKDIDLDDPVNQNINQALSEIAK